MIKKYAALIGALAMLPMALSVRAAIITNVAIQSASSFYSNGTTDQRTPTNLVNGSGLFGFNHTYNATGAMWQTSDTSVGAFSNAYVVFDLGAVHNLSQLKIYNYDEGAPTASGYSNGMRVADIMFGSDSGVFTNTLAAETFTQAPGGTSTTLNFRDFSQLVNLTNISARYIAITNVQTNWGPGAVGSNAYKTGLSKVLFIDPTVQAGITLATMNVYGNSITVWFTEPVQPGSATNFNNYSITSTGGDSPTVIGATMGAFNDSVILSTSSLTNSFSAYSINISGVAAASDGSLITNSAALQSQVACWFKADAGVTTTDGTNVSLWADQSGNGNDAVMNTNATQPTLVQNFINGLPAIKFGSGHYLEVPYSSTMQLQRDFTIVAVEKMAAAPTSSNGELLSRAAVNRAAPFDYRIVAANCVLYRGNQGGGSSFDNVTGLANTGANVATMMEVVMNGTNCTHYLNGLGNGTGIELTGFLDSPVPTRIAGRADNGTSFNGSISEIILFRGALSTADRLALNGYFAAKYALPITDLAFTTVPVSTNIYEGRTYTFTSVAVSSSTNAIHYQWQTNGVNIPGATNANYTTPTLTLADSTEQFTVIATAGTSVVTSTPPAVLTVLVDSTPPTANYAGKEIWDGTKVVVVFSEAVDPVTATMINNYQLVDAGSAPITINAAAIGDTPNKVVLSTSSTNGYSISVNNVQDLFGNVMSSTQLALVYYPDLVLWLRSDVGVTVSGSGTVAEWDDQSGNANDVYGQGDPYDPLLTNGFNNLPAIYFNGSNFLYSVSSSTLGVTGDMAVYAVLSFSQDPATGGNAILNKDAGNANNIAAPYDMYMLPADGRIRFYRGDGGTGGNLVDYGSMTSSRAPSLGAPHMVVESMSNTTASAYLDGAANGSGTINVPFVDGGGPFAIGGRADFFTTTGDVNPASPKMNGSMAEIMMFTVALSATDRAELDNYLGTKYAIPFSSSLPSITIARTGPSTVQLSWPTPLFNFALQATSNLSATNWTTVTNSVSALNGTNSVSVNLTGTNQFFRLQKQP